MRFVLMRFLPAERPVSFVLILVLVEILLVLLPFLLHVLLDVSVSGAHLARHFLGTALILQLLVVEHLAGRLLDLAGSLVNPSFDLVLVHGSSIHIHKYTRHGRHVGVAAAAAPSA